MTSVTSTGLSRFHTSGTYGNRVSAMRPLVRALGHAPRGLARGGTIS